ncbi:MAG: 5'-nucleotidase C-terminal domain-containing protein [Acinetobacter populi]|jgi:5'-nucleotidase|uniref:bifunctional metallophosphatase/5'-nucleotidase n=1 Tax=Acinetobacter populi TaxID=1582270 RepID=UPI002354D852|nr:5'-nucleotidase C-terminal domain-containing protein [Acinetobacter populi]MCH4246276.1 5'-nucleotidase C-terminal domain-containing protein [Acinetobacter populi]
MQYIHHGNSKKYRLLGLSLLLSSALLAGCNDNDDDEEEIAAQPLEINILHINDSHSHLDEESTTFNLLTAENTREAITVFRGGFSRVTALINALAESEKNPIKIHAGDTITGDLYFTLGEGKAEADLMNTVCFDTFTLGNHEFDNGDEGLKKLIGFLNNGTCSTPTQVLSANVEFGATSPLYKTDLVKPYTIIEKEGQKIGLIGLTIAGKTKNSSRPNEDTIFSDEVTTAQKYIDELKAQGINKIIIQSHIGYDKDLELATQLSGVDVIIGGDSHTLLGDSTAMTNYGLTPEGAYPTISKDKDGHQVCIGQAWQYAYVVGQMKVNFDANGVVTDCTGRPNMLLGDQFSRASGATLSSREVATIKQDITNSGFLKIVQPDSNADRVLLPYASAKVLFGSEQVAVATENLCLRRVPGTTKDTSRSTLGDECNKSDFVNKHGGDVQQLVAEAFLQQGKSYFNADISIQNGGGVRIDLPKGNITVNTIYQVLPFKNTLVQLSMTGAEIKAVLEDVMDTITTGSTGGYPYAGGLRWDVDLSQSKGNRLSGLEVRDASGNYQTLDLSKTYQVITIDYLADGSDGFTSFANITGSRRSDVGLDYAEAFLQYVENLEGTAGQKQLSRLPVEYYSTQNYKE